MQFNIYNQNLPLMRSAIFHPKLRVEKSKRKGTAMSSQAKVLTGRGGDLRSAQGPRPSVCQPFLRLTVSLGCVADT